MSDGGEAHDPRVDPAPLEDVPGLLREGADLYNGERFWHAHEAWEEAWHALRGANRRRDAEFLQGMILVTAAFENCRRGKEQGFKRQMAQGIHQLRGNPGSGTRLGLTDEPGWVDALVAQYLDACRTHHWGAWRRDRWDPPRLTLDD